MTDRNPPGLPPPTGRSVDGLPAPDAVATVPNASSGNGRDRRVVVRLVAVLAVVALVGVLAMVISRGDDGTTAADRTTTTTNTLSTLAAAPPPAAGEATVPSAATTTTTTAATAATTTSPAATTTTTTTTPTTTTVTTTAATTTTVTTTTSTIVAVAATTVAPSTDPPNKELVVIAGRKGACRFGNNCLIAGFSIWSFETNPTSFVCEFASGRRYTISFTGTVVETACFTAAVPDSITIEVDGVRSETITNDNPDPSA